MCRSKTLDEVRYPDPFLDDLARRVALVVSLADRFEEPMRFLDDLRLALAETAGGRAGVPAR